MNKLLQNMKHLSAGIFILLCAQIAFAQTAAVSVPVSIGRTSCGGGTRGVQEFNYNGTTNVLTNLNAICQPNLASPGFSTNLTGDAFNPADTSLYIVRTTYSGVTPTTYVWRYKMPGCPGSSLALYRTFVNWDIAGLVFDRNGAGYWIEFVGVAPYKLGLRRVNFAAGTIGALDTLQMTGFNMYNLNGDLALTPKGAMYASFDNKMFTVDYASYDGNPATKIPTTYIDTVRAPTGTSMVGLCYADGKMLASYSPGCVYREINLLNGDTSLVTYGGGGTTTSYDLTSIVSSLGLSKTLVSSIPTGTPGEYDLDYNIKIENLGNYSLDSLQVSDNLLGIYGPGNVTVTSVSFVTNPGTVFLNAGYNGVGNNNLFSNSPTLSRLKNFPTSQSVCVISIKCRVRNIIPGVIYNNNATGTVKGYRSVLLRDISTDGTLTDPNSNDKADDAGESQPTPFFISVAPETPPCISLSSVLYSQDYGSGTGITGIIPGSTKTQYTSYGGTVPLIEERYAVTNNPINGNATRWENMTDHTGGVNGRMLVVNADNLPQKIFFDTINVSCAQFKYSLFAYAAFIGNETYKTFCNGVGGYKYAKLTFIARNAITGRIIAANTTGDITSSTWTQYGMKWVMPAGVTRVALEIYNSGPGGCGNDMALDDVQFGLCDVLPTVNASGTDGCLGGSTTFDVTLTDTIGLSNFLTYQWQSASAAAGPWTDIGGATNVNYTINPLLPVHARYYRLIVSNGSPSCRFISPGFLLSLKSLSLPALSASRNKNNFCPGDAVTLRANGGFLGTAANWRWYTGSCGGTLVGTGATITVNPVVTTTYYVRAEGDCNNTTCQAITVNISCDIDDDDDGIPDITENGGMDVEGDDDFDGVVNWRDSNMAGFVDSNGDGVDDRYDFDLDGIINQYDRDSDNDGIPDVVESYGVDTDGNGIIDNYTDTDGDGFSQNVDGNTTGHLTSGNGLGRLDLDGDGQPNFMDMDSDGDGIPDIREAFRADTDNNGRIDGAWTDPDNDGYHSAIDADADGNGTNENIGSALLRSGADGNSDGRADSWPNKNMDRDARPNPYDLDSDGDGLSDVLEVRLATFADTNNDGMADGTIGGNGWNSAIDALASITLPNTDGDALSNMYDIDSDGDGITDNIEIQTTFLPGANYLLPAAADIDLDGIDDQYDSNVGVFGGARITPVDTDSDGTPDYLDLDSDSDGQPDIIEGNDFNQNRINDDFITPAGADTDGDGLDNTFDNDNANPYINSPLLGSGGSFTGTAPFGTRSPVTRSYAFQYDRDWRFNGMILAVNLISFNGNLFGETSHLTWSVYATEPLQKFVVERSLNGADFTQVGEVMAAGGTGIVQNYSFDDRVAGVPFNQFYYRIKIIGTSTRQKLSQVILLRREQRAGNGVEIMPVPASAYFNVTISSALKTKGMVDLMSVDGKLLERKEVALAAGTNVVGFTGITQYPAGMYQVRVHIGGEVYNVRLVKQ